MASPSKTIDMGRFPLGMDNRRRETDGYAPNQRGQMTPVQALREAVNVDISASGHVSRRPGYVQALAGRFHSVWADERYPFLLAVRDGFLNRYDSLLNETELVAVAPHLPLSYTLMNGEVYWSNSEATGRITAGGMAKSWGMPVAGAPVVVVTAGGGLAAGQYRVAQRFMKAGGEVGGSGGETVVTVPDGAGLSVTTAFSGDPDVVLVELFVSQPNGEVLYRVMGAPEGATVSVGPSMLGRGAALDTQHLVKPFAGQLVRSYKGRIYVASGAVLWATEPLRFGLMNPAQDLIVFPSEITLLQPVLDGLYVGCDAEGVVFLKGDDLTDFDKIAVDASPVVRGSGTTVPGNRFGVSQYARSGAEAAEAALWWGQDTGLCLGAPGGVVRRLTNERVAAPRFGAGTLGLFEHDGYSQILSLLRDEGVRNNTAVGDSVIAEVKRNGVLVQ